MVRDFQLPAQGVKKTGDTTRSTFDQPAQKNTRESQMKSFSRGHTGCRGLDHCESSIIKKRKQRSSRETRDAEWNPPNITRSRSTEYRRFVGNKRDEKERRTEAAVLRRKTKIGGATEASESPRYTARNFNPAVVSRPRVYLEKSSSRFTLSLSLRFARNSAFTWQPRSKGLCANSTLHRDEGEVTNVPEKRRDEKTVSLSLPSLSIESAEFLEFNASWRNEPTPLVELKLKRPPFERQTTLCARSTRDRKYMHTYVRRVSTLLTACFRRLAERNERKSATIWVFPRFETSSNRDFCGRLIFGSFRLGNRDEFRCGCRILEEIRKITGERRKEA